MQGSGVLRQWSEVTSEEHAIAVLDTVRTTVGASGLPGHEYTLDGHYTGVSSVFPNVPGLAIYDAATDGRYLYGWDFNYNRAMRFDLDWSHPVTLFSIDGSVADFLGITYDPSNQSLWISGWARNELRDYSLSGTLIQSFAVSHNENAALARDPATGTLWLANRNIYGQFEEYSTAGVLLAVESYSELGSINVLGGEFQVPEPASLALLAVGLFGGRRIMNRLRPHRGTR